MDSKDSIFRFRAINDYSLNAFLDDELYIASPNAFNDPFDSSFVYDLDKVVDSFLQNQGFLKNIFIYSFFQQHKRKPSDNEINNALLEFNNDKQRLKNIIKEQCIKSLYFLRSEYLVGCFTKRVDNSVLWAHYGQCGKGFVLEYRKNDLYELLLTYFKKIHYNKKLSTIFDVSYDNNVFERTDLMISILESFSEFLVETVNNPRVKRFRYEPSEENLKAIFTHKAFNWSYENEQRIIVPNTNLGESFRCLGNIKPVAVYLGTNMEKYNRYLLIKACKEKGILVYQMRNNFEKGLPDMGCDLLDL